MKLSDQKGASLPEATLSINAEEIIDLLQGLADVVEGKREHLHFKQVGGPELVVNLVTDEDDELDPIGRQMDWYVGPVILFGALFLVIGMITVARWAVGLLG
jgi:hypothetical protein